MAIPKVFISSTCYDLKYIRENIRYFVKTLGYDPVLSEDGSVFYNPAQHTHDACLTEIPNTQLFVLIIGGRHGGKFHSSDASITNAEYREAVRLKIPVFALVESGVYAEHHVYTRNKRNSEVDLTKLKFPSVDSLDIFKFIDEVRGNAINNAIVPFRDFGDIESYLRQQWAAMMFDFLSKRNEERRVSDTLTALAVMNERIEILSEQILASVGTDAAKLNVELYEELLTSHAVRDLVYWGTKPSPSHILSHDTFASCANALGIQFSVDESEGYAIGAGPNPSISKDKYNVSVESYKTLQDNLITILTKNKRTKEQYLHENPPRAPQE